MQIWVWTILIGGAKAVKRAAIRRLADLGYQGTPDPIQL